jgi:hypothetical protein
MFIGHFALGYAAKRWAPGASLALLFAAAQFADFLWPLLVAAGVEHVRIAPGFTASTPLEFLSYPYSHSLVMLVIWGALVAWLAVRGSAGGRRVGAIVFALVVSHWVLDVLVHVPDMPVYPGGPKYGLGLWNAPLVEKFVETVMFTAALAMYLRQTAARDRIGRWATWGLAAFLIVGFLFAGAPPPSVAALWSVALGLGGLTLWLAWWADKHRTARSVR